MAKANEDTKSKLNHETWSIKYSADLIKELVNGTGGDPTKLTPHNIKQIGACCDRILSELDVIERYKVLAMKMWGKMEKAGLGMASENDDLVHTIAVTMGYIKDEPVDVMDISQWIGKMSGDRNNIRNSVEACLGGTRDFVIGVYGIISAMKLFAESAHLHGICSRDTCTGCPYAPYRSEKCVQNVVRDIMASEGDDYDYDDESNWYADEDDDF